MSTGSARDRPVVLVLVTAVIAGGVGFLAGSSSEHGASAPPSAAAPVASVAGSTLASSSSSAPSAPAAASAGAEPTLLDAARGGDLRALKTLELRPVEARTPEEALAIAAGHAELARRDAAALVSDLGRDPLLFADRSTMAYAYRLALDPEVAPQLLAAFAALEHPSIADFLFDLVMRSEPGSRLHLLSADLLHGPAVRGEVSKALSIALDLRAARSCERAAALLPQAQALADERATPFLERFRVEKGCGPKGEDDCYACLRAEAAKKALDDAIDAAKERRFDAPWRAPQRSK